MCAWHASVLATHECIRACQLQHLGIPLSRRELAVHLVVTVLIVDPLGAVLLKLSCRSRGRQRNNVRCGLVMSPAHLHCTTLVLTIAFQGPVIPQASNARSTRLSGVTGASKMGAERSVSVSPPWACPMSTSWSPHLFSPTAPFCPKSMAPFRAQTNNTKPLCVQTHCSCRVLAISINTAGVFRAIDFG
jgi:hypothetical protein